MKKRYTLYVDESGQANVTESTTRYFVLAGLIVEEHVDQEISAYFSYIKRRYNLPEDRNFHAFEFFEGTKTELAIPEREAKKFIHSLAEFAETAPFRIIVVGIDKRMLAKLLKLPKNYKFSGSQGHKEEKEVAYEILGTKIFWEFGRFLKENNGLGAVVAESRRASDRLLLKTYLEAQFVSNTAPRSAQIRARSFRDLVVSLCFENKNGLRGGLELVDIYSYLAYKKLVGISPRMRKRGSGELLAVITKQLRSKKKESKFLLTQAEINGLSKDKIHRIANRVEQRVKEIISTPVNPTRRRESTKRSVHKADEVIKNEEIN